jgi:hypothetical protein
MASAKAQHDLEHLCISRLYNGVGTEDHHSMFGPGGLLLVVSHLIVVSVLV